jgi:hypothetical protein
MLDLARRIFAVVSCAEPFVDVYNVSNANTILTEVTTVGSSLGVVSATINPRLVRVGGKFTF